MPKLHFVFALLACFCAANVVAAGGVYKCTNDQGGISFQDLPCPVGANETQLHMSTASPIPDTDVVLSIASTPPPAPRTTATPLPRQPLPALWVCTSAEDGKQYMSRDGTTQPRLVPLGVMGLPGKSLAAAYGPGGIGVSAPGVRATPIDRSPQAAVASNYVAVQDQCVHATPDETCGYLQEQLDQVRTKLHRAFKDERATLTQQATQLDHELDGC